MDEPRRAALRAIAADPADTASGLAALRRLARAGQPGLALIAEALSAEPSAGAWLTLTRGLERVEDGLTEPLLPFIDAALEPWPAALRTAPPHWFRPLLEAAQAQSPAPREPRYRLARRLRFHLFPRELEPQPWIARELPRLQILELIGTALLHQSGQTLLSGLPMTLKTLTLRYGALRPEILFGEPCLAGLERLTLASFGLPASRLSTLAALDFERLRFLDLSHNAVDASEDEAAAFAAAPWLRTLEELRFERFELRGALPVLTRMLHCGACPRLKLLDVSQCTGAEIGPLIASRLPDLEELRLAYFALDDAGLARMIQAGLGERALRSLDLRGNRLTAPKALARLGGLEELDLRDNFLADTGWLRRLPRLRKLRLGYALSRTSPRPIALSFKGLDHLRSLTLSALSLSRRLERQVSALPLEERELSGSAISAAGLEDILAMPGLRRLGLRAVGIEASDLKRALEGSRATLGRLDLSKNPIGDEGLKALLDSPAAARLEVLDLRACQLEEGALRALAQWPGLARLRVLDLSDNAFDIEALRELAASPSCGPGLRPVLRSDDIYAFDPRRRAIAQSFPAAFDFGGLDEGED